MFTFNLIYPVNLQDFFGALFPLLTFDMIPTDEIYETIFGFSKIDTQPLTDQLDAVGYSSTITVINMGSLFIFIIILPVFTLLA